MKIHVECYSLKDAARLTGCLDDFTDEGWEFLEEYLDNTLCYDENPFTGVHKLEHEFCEEPAFSYLDFSKLKVDVNEDDVLDWLVENDYILGYYDSYTKYIMFDRNTHNYESAPYDDLPEEFLK